VLGSGIGGGSIQQRGSFAEAEYVGKKKQTRHDKFLAQMEQVVPWARPVARLRPFYPEGEQGQLPTGLERMMRVFFVQQGGLTPLYRSHHSAIKSFLDLLYFGCRHILQIQQGISRGPIDPDQLVELEMKCARVAALRTLDEEHYQDSHNGSSGVNDQLPRIGPAGERSRNRPDEEDSNRHIKRFWRSGLLLDQASEPIEFPCGFV
jgi:hypothetical protein